MVSASAGCLLIIWLLPSIGLAARSMTAAITATPAVAPPSTKFTLIGHGFGPSEVVDLEENPLGPRLRPLSPFEPIGPKPTSTLPIPATTLMRTLSLHPLSVV